jgi:ABC-type transport system involved in Fe-S cluster assembly fused permease/ATPase subunit
MEKFSPFAMKMYIESNFLSFTYNNLLKIMVVYDKYHYLFYHSFFLPRSFFQPKKVRYWCGFVEFRHIDLVFLPDKIALIYQQVRLD